MVFAENSRRAFIKQALLSAFAIPLTPQLFRPRDMRVVVRLEGQADDLGRELVNFGLPLPFGMLNEASRVRVVAEDGAEIIAAVRSLEPWRVAGRAGSIRALQVQFQLDFSGHKKRQVTVLFDRSAMKTALEFVAVANTLRDEKGLKGPRVLAVLPADWLCASGIVGPQTPTALSREYSSYDRMVEKNFPGSLAYLDSSAYANWLFDRTTCYYKMYVRSGESKYLKAAYHAANFVREHTKLDGPDAGIFTLKGPDLKYVYPRAMHIHYLLTGDERALACGKLMAKYCFNHQDPVYRPDLIKPVQ